MDSTKNTQTTPANTVESNNNELQLDVRRARTVRTGIKAGLADTLGRSGAGRTCAP